MENSHNKLITVLLSLDNIDSDILNRTIRPTQNWEKLLYANYLDINCDLERRS